MLTAGRICQSGAGSGAAWQGMTVLLSKAAHEASTFHRAAVVRVKTHATQLDALVAQLIADARPTDAAPNLLLAVLCRKLAYQGPLYLKVEIGEWRTIRLGVTKTSINYFLISTYSIREANRGGPQVPHSEPSISFELTV